MTILAITHFPTAFIALIAFLTGCIVTAALTLGSKALAGDTSTEREVEQYNDGNDD